MLSLFLLTSRSKTPLPTAIASLFHRTFPTTFLLSPINHLVFSFLSSYDCLLIPLFFSFHLAPHLPSPHRYSLLLSLPFFLYLSAFTHQSPCLFVPLFLRLFSNPTLLFFSSCSLFILSSPPSPSFCSPFSRFHSHFSNQLNFNLFQISFPPHCKSIVFSR